MPGYGWPSIPKFAKICSDDKVAISVPLTIATPLLEVRLSS